jgi:hypothetical protein
MNAGGPQQLGQVADALRIDVDGSGQLAGEARNIFELAVKRYAQDLLNEASLYEMTHRANSSSIPQYTSAHVVQAEGVVRTRGAAPRQKSGWLVVARVALYVLAIVVAVSSGNMAQTVSWMVGAEVWGVLFTASATLALCLTIAIEITDHKERLG